MIASTRTAPRTFHSLFYAALYWVDHSKFGDVSSTIPDEMERLFDQDKPHFATWVWLYDIDYPWGGHVSTTRPTEPETTPLYYAVLCGFRGLVEHLLSIRPEDINPNGGYYGTPLHAALSRRPIDISLLLLQHGADINALDEDELSPLHDASRSGRGDIVQLLLEHHADVNLPNGDRETPLWLASCEGELEVARIFLQNGADVELCDKQGRAVMNVTSANGHPRNGTITTR